MKRTLNIIFLLLFLTIGSTSARSDSYFADGYHGGIYGHYPIGWYTQFMVDKMNQNPQWKLGLEIEPETWDSVRIKTPEAFTEFSDLLACGRMEYTNPTYAQPYCFNISGESIIRQFLYGIRSLRSNFPGIRFSTYSCEEPCFTSSLPAILSGFGFKYISLKCPDTCWGGYMAPMGGEFIMLEGPDGTRIPASPRYDCEALQPATVWQTTAWCNSKSYLDACRDAGIRNPIGMCYQDAGWRNGPWLGNNPNGSEYVLWTEYFNRFFNKKKAPTVRFSQMDVRTNLMWGTSVLRRIARQVRAAENILVSAEKIGFIASMGSDPFAADGESLHECWRRLMLAQHHDSWIVPYNRLWNFGTWADAIGQWTDFAREGALKEITAAAEAVNPGNVLMLKVFNTTLYNRDEYISVDIPDEFAGKADKILLLDSEGNCIRPCITEITDNYNDKVKRLFFKASVPPLGYTSYKIGVAEDKLDLEDFRDEKNSDLIVKVSNSMVSFSLDLMRGGTIRSLILHQNGDIEFAPSAGEQFALGELRGFFYDEGEYKSSTDAPARIIAFEKNDNYQKLKIAGEISGHPFTQTYTLTDGCPRIDCSLRIDWNGNPGIGEYADKNWKKDRRGFCDDRYKLSLLLPLSYKADKLLKDAPFDICECDTAASYFNRWSDIRNNILLNWIDFANQDDNIGLGIISDHTTSYSFGPEYPAAITLHYSGPGLWGAKYKTEGPLEVKYSIVVHSGDESASVMARESEKFNEPLKALFCKGSGIARSESIMSADTPGYRLSAVYCNADGSRIMRLHNETACEPCNISFCGHAVCLTPTDLEENPSGPALTNTEVFTVDIPRNAIATYSITD